MTDLFLIMLITKIKRIKTKKKSIGSSISNRISIMEKIELKEISKKISTAGDLATVLDEIKRNEFGKVRYGISEKMLRYFSSDSISPKRFRTFHIKKKSGGLR